MAYLEDDIQRHVNSVIERTKAFYAADEPGHFLVVVDFPVPPSEVALPPLYDFDLDTQLLERQAMQLEIARCQLAAKRGLDDDMIPAIMPRFGIAEHTAWVGMEVKLQEDTCLPQPALHETNDLQRLAFSEDSPWFKYMRRCYEFLREQQDGTYVLAARLESLVFPGWVTRRRGVWLGLEFY